MRVSIIIPTYNRKDYVQQAIDSVLAQTYTDYEIIVVDDGSTDGTGEALKRYGDRICYVYQENRGEAAARNEGIRRATGEYIALLDSDDLWLPQKLERQVAFLDTHPEYALVGCHALIIDNQGNYVGSEPLYSHQTEEKIRLETLVLCPPTQASTIVVRKSCLNEVGLFDETLRYGEDAELWLRIASRFHLGFIPEALAYARSHSNMQSSYVLPDSEVERRLSDRIRMIEKAFALYPAEESLFRLKSKVLAQECARAGLGYYWNRLYDRAAECLTRAVSLDPAGWADGRQFSSMLAHCAESILMSGGETATLAFVNDVFAHLPPRLAAIQKEKRRVLAHVYIALAFRYHAWGNRISTARQALRGIVRNPEWLMNRGVMSILLESLVGRHIMRQVRKCIRRTG